MFMSDFVRHTLRHLELQCDVHKVKYVEKKSRVMCICLHEKKGTASDVTWITPSGVCEEAGRQDCRREVSAQEGEVPPSARSEL